MYPSVKQQIPKFIEEYLVYCDCFTDINKKKTCLVLTRNLKFFEFCQKQLVAAVDLQTTCMNKLKDDLKNYKGAKGKWNENSNTSPPATGLTENKISFGKYVFHALNIQKTYVIIKCWDKCVVLQKLPDFKGFKIEAQYVHVESYRIIHGKIKYCPVLEINFQNSILKTDFQDKGNSSGDEDLPQQKGEMRHLLEQIRCAKTELHLHKLITAQSFCSRQNNLTFGKPFLRSLKLEEKQILNRCGDIWKRFTAQDELVIGVPLINQCASPNLTIIRNLKPVLQTNQLLETPIHIQYRLYQLSIKFDQLDDLQTFLESEDEKLQEKIWSVNGDLHILPESFVVLLIKFKISEIISLKESSLILNYEIIKRLHNTSDAVDTTFSIPLQLFLQNLDFYKYIFEERSNYELKFVLHTLHQDFLTIAMTATETNIRITFNSCQDLDVFENSIQKTLNFSKPTVMSSCGEYFASVNSVFYNNNASSSWFGSLILRMKKATDDENNQYLTTWRIYCPNNDKMLLLLKTFFNDHIMLQCNVKSISNCDDQNTCEYITNFENALRQELQQHQEIVNNVNNKNYYAEHVKNLEKLCELQMNSDIIASNAIITK